MSLRSGWRCITACRNNLCPYSECSKSGGGIHSVATSDQQASLFVERIRQPRNWKKISHGWLRKAGPVYLRSESRWDNRAAMDSRIEGTGFSASAAGSSGQQLGIVAFASDVKPTYFANFRAASSRLRSPVYFHHGFFGSPCMNLTAEMNVSSRQGSCRWPV
jgi:hypothetical protein